MILPLARSCESNDLYFLFSLWFCHQFTYLNFIQLILEYYQVLWFNFYFTRSNVCINLQYKLIRHCILYCIKLCSGHEDYHFSYNTKYKPIKYALLYIYLGGIAIFTSMPSYIVGKKIQNKQDLINYKSFSCAKLCVKHLPRNWTVVKFKYLIKFKVRLRPI